MEVVCVCKEGQQFQDTIKWEVYPETEGSVEIFASSSPDNFNLSSPYTTANISDRVVLIPRLSENRKYFMVSFDRKEQVFVTNRILNVEGVANIRDIGGYANETGEFIKWGKIFRSGKLIDITENGMEKLNQLHIKSLVDLRTRPEKLNENNALTFPEVIEMPMKLPFNEKMKNLLMQERCKRTDAIVYMQDCFYQFTKDYQKELASLMNRLTKKNSYPVLIECGTGNNRSGFVTAMIMLALEIPEETIIQDYLLSNSYIDIEREAAFGRQLPISEQEALTVFMSAQRGFMEYAFEKIKQENGSIENYLSKKLRMTPQKREKLQQILLTR
ncbi:MAG: tyrosine-protein phosphatase [Bacteroidales bacterium]|nr:tyrosine-protein phosphatase [Bacteroidales bacterium]